MKKILFFSLLLLCVNLFSQSFGFKAGISLPNVSIVNHYTDISIEPSNNIGLNGGFFVDFSPSGKFTLSSALYYNQSSVNVKAVTAFPQITNSIDYKVEFIVYQLLAKYYFTRSGLKPYTFTGPQLSFLIGDRSTSSTYTIPEGEQIRISDNINKTIFSFAIGAGIDLRTSKKTSVFIESQFSPGIMNTYEDDNVSAKTNSLEIKTGININF